MKWFRFDHFIYHRALDNVILSGIAKKCGSIIVSYINIHQIVIKNKKESSIISVFDYFVNEVEKI